MTHSINFILLGLGNGAVFAALAMALVVVYRSSGVLNFATGALALHAAYTYAFLRKGKFLVPIPGVVKTIDMGGPIGKIEAIALVIVLEAVLGVLLYLCIFRFLRNHLPVAKAVASLGVMVLLTAVITMQAGVDQILVKPIFPADRWKVGPYLVLSDRVYFVAVILGLAFVLAAIYRYTPFGMATRASAETEVGAIVSGLSPDRIAMINWAIAGVVCAVAGILIAPLVPLVPGTYTLFIVPALAAAVLGNFSALMPAVFGGLAIGMLQSEAVYLKGQYSWLPQAGLSEMIPLVIVLVVLLVRGKPLPTRGMITEQTLGGAPRPRNIWIPVAVLVPVGIVLMYVLNDSYRASLMETCIYGVLALSLIVITGYLGQLSLAQITLAGAGAYLLSTFSTSWGIPFPIAPLLAAAGATAIGVIVGLPALRIRGMLVAVVTLAMAVALEAVWFRNPNLNGGTGGAKIANPSLFGIDLGIGTGKAFPRPEFGVLCIVTLALVAIGVARLRGSRLGSAMLAVRNNERSAAAAGISVTRVKIMGFACSSFIAAIGGCLLAYKQTNVSPIAFNSLLGLLIFATTFLIGVTSITGGIFAGVTAASGIFILFLTNNLSDVVDIGQWYGIVSGLALVVVVIQNPNGAIGPALEKSEERRQKRIAKQVALAEQGDAESRAILHLSAPGTTPPIPVSATVAAGDPDTVLLGVRNLRVAYGGVVALDDVSYDVKPGRIVGIIGPNGAGKTTMMDGLCGFARSTGHVVFAGESMYNKAPHQRARQGLARTFQGMDLYEDLTVEENIKVGQYIVGKKGPNVDQLLESLGLLQLKERNVGELSQGHRQLVSIARAMASGPRLLLLDEPAAGLDTSESLWLADRLRALADAGVAIVLVDHDMHLVLGLCDEIHVLDFGRQIASGPPEQIRTNRQVAEAYLGSSHTQEVLA